MTANRDRRRRRFSDADVARMRAEWQEVLDRLAAYYRLPVAEVASWRGSALAFALAEAGLPSQRALADRWGTTHPYWHDLVFMGRDAIRRRQRRARLRRLQRARSGNDNAVMGTAESTDTGTGRT
jgi:hypothetical protein